jgi:predicted ester cyclase
MSTEANKSLVHHFFEAFNAGDLDGVAAVFAPNAVVHNSGAPDPLNVEGFKQLAAVFLAAFPGGKHTIEDMIVEGDKVITRITYHGTHTGDLMGIPPRASKWRRQP